MREAHRQKVLLTVQQGPSLGNRMGEFDSVLFPIIGLILVQDDTQSMEALLLLIHLRLELRDGILQQGLLFFGIIGLRLDRDPHQVIPPFLNEMNRELHVNPVMQADDHVREFSESLFGMALRNRKADLFIWCCAHLFSVLAMERMDWMSFKAKGMGSGMISTNGHCDCTSKSPFG